jgi:hypothetical protein
VESVADDQTLQHESAPRSRRPERTEKRVELPGRPVIESQLAFVEDGVQDAPDEFGFSQFEVGGRPGLEVGIGLLVEQVAQPGHEGVVR